MTDQELFEQFETGTLKADIFDHSAHVKMAWIYLNKYELPEALCRFSNALKNFAKVNKSDEIYHQTITFAFLMLINERIKKMETQSNWEDFKLHHPDLFDWKNNVLKRFYQEETLKSAFAKKNFVFPDNF